VKVVELYRIAGQPAEGIKPEVVAAWLPSPTGTSGDAIVLFYDEDSLWSMTAWYDVARLRSHPPAAVAAAVG